MRGPVWDRLLREYYFERVFVDITVERMVAWPDLGAFGDDGGDRSALARYCCPAAAAEERDRPAGGCGPGPPGGSPSLPHRVLAYRGADGFPVVVPVEARRA